MYKIKYERPVLIVGNGCRGTKIGKLATKLGWPVLVSWGFIDFKHKNVIDQFGVYGSRGANYTVQNADLILSIGCRLDTRMTGSNPKQFAREAKKIIVDIDKNELNKGVVIPDIKVNMDAGEFIDSILKKKFKKNDYIKQCKKWQKAYPIQIPNGLTPYLFYKVLGEESKCKIFTADTGANMIILYQMLKRRIVSSLGHSPMGYALPAGIGIGLLGKEVIVITGDGGMQMNIQELQTIKNYDVPIKVFVISNQGYCLIRQFQDLYMGKRHVGTEEGVPDFAKVADAYGIPSMTIKNAGDMREQIKKALKMRQVIVNVITDPCTTVLPRAIFGKPIEEQHPFLPDEEVVKNLIVKRWTS